MAWKTDACPPTERTHISHEMLPLPFKTQMQTSSQTNVYRRDEIWRQKSSLNSRCPSELGFLWIVWKCCLKCEATTQNRKIAIRKESSAEMLWHLCFVLVFAAIDSMLEQIATDFETKYLHIVIKTNVLSNTQTKGQTERGSSLSGMQWCEKIVLNQFQILRQLICLSNSEKKGVLRGMKECKMVRLGRVINSQLRSTMMIGIYI